MKILHSADWHMDSAFSGRTEAQSVYLRQELLKIPRKIADLCRSENCDLLLLAGDLFDGAYTKESYQAVYDALKEVRIPVFIAPGNHDFCQPNSPYIRENWPENVHIFTHTAVESQSLPELDCRVYGAGYTAMDCPALLEDFRAKGPEKWQIGVFHADPAASGSPYCPVTAQQVHISGLQYLALGHIHKGGSFRSGNTLCAWPGCPMGRGFDEPGQKGVILVTLEDQVGARFMPLDTPRFFDETLDVGEDPSAALGAMLPAAATNDIYRVTLTGYCGGVETQALRKAFAHIPNLELRDRTVPETDIWSHMDQDSLEGMYFRILHEAMDNTDSQRLERCIQLAARISRQILDGQEVTLP